MSRVKFRVNDKITVTNVPVDERTGVLDKTISAVIIEILSGEGRVYKCRTYEDGTINGNRVWPTGVCFLGSWNFSKSKCK